MTQQGSNSGTQNFMCLNLANNSSDIKTLDDTFSEIKKGKGFHAFYTNETLISGIQNSVGGSSKVLKEKFSRFFNNLKYLSIAENTCSKLSESSSNTPLVLINGLGSSAKAEMITTFFQGLRELLGERKFKENIGFSLNEASSWDLFLEREKYSGIIPDAHDYQEYLLWDSANTLDLSPKDGFNGSDVWLGAGWINSRLRRQKSDFENQVHIEKLDFWCRNANDNLSRSLDKLANFYQNKGIAPCNLENNTNFIRSLCEFLPYHKSCRTNRIIPSNSLGERGGPMRWRGFLDDQMYLRKRHLLMDGWLTLWSVKENQETTLYVQPGSLAILYWAAKTASMPHTDSPDVFLENYDWSDPRWFGGNWKKVQKNG